VWRQNTGRAELAKPLGECAGGGGSGGGFPGSQVSGKCRRSIPRVLRGVTSRGGG